MGCNYYFIPKRKKKVKLTEFESMFYCLDVNPMHIGKSSVGWTFSFQATPYYKSFKEIKEFYSKYKDKVKIIDEYDRTVKFDHFIALVEAKLKELNNHSIYMQKEYDEFAGDDYLDNEGHSFSKRDFS